MSSYEHQRMMELASTMERVQKLKQQQQGQAKHERKHNEKMPLFSSPKQAISGFNLDEPIALSSSFKEESSRPMPIPTSTPDEIRSMVVSPSSQLAISPKKEKPTSKAQRRALQEAQRTAKQQRLAAEGKTRSSSIGSVSSINSATSTSLPAKTGSTANIPISQDDQKKRKKTSITASEITLFSHLQPYERLVGMSSFKSNVHPAILQLGLKFSEQVIVGANARCLAMLNALRKVIQDYKTPSDQVMNRHLDSHLKPMINHLVQFRPMAVSMGNAIRYLKLKIANLDPDMPEADVSSFFFAFSY
jgi:hypothetical protein